MRDYVYSWCEWKGAGSLSTLRIQIYVLRNGFPLCLHPGNWTCRILKNDGFVKQCLLSNDPQEFRYAVGKGLHLYSHDMGFLDVRPSIQRKIGNFRRQMLRAKIHGIGSSLKDIRTGCMHMGVSKNRGKNPNGR